MYKSLSILMLLLFGKIGYSQTLITPYGGSQTNNGVSLSFSLGEAVTNTGSAGGYYLTQGFHQTKAKLVSISEVGAFADLTAYPNPFTNQVHLSGLNLSEITAVKVFDSRGQLVFHQPQFNMYEPTVSLQTLAKGVYFLSAFSKENHVKIFQLIKH